MGQHASWALSYAVAHIREGQERGDIGTHATAEEIATSLMCIIRGLSLITMSGSADCYTAPSADTIMRMVLPGHVIASRDRHEPAGRKLVAHAPAKAARARSARSTAAPSPEGTTSNLISLPAALPKAAARTRTLPKKTARKATR
jgi:hypothetical protein